ncbi:hypothetical protein EXS74_01220 [Candidatus Woesearchaeota archaeon]|nr:hypothetical protein [Candidatus Woesearchaeota archaeon]
MVSEKNILVVLIFVIGAMLFLSLVPRFTGYTVSEKNGEASATLSDVLAGEPTKGKLQIEVTTDTLSYGKVIATGEAASWISFIAEKYAFIPDVETEIPFYVTVPQGTAEGTYEAKVALLSEDLGGDGSIIQDSIISYIPITITVTQEEKTGSIDIDSFTVYTTEENEEKVYYQVELSNDGNRGKEEDITIEIYDSKGAILSTETLSSKFLAYEEKSLVASFSQNLGQGKYYARMIIGDQTRSTSFSVVPEGSLKQKGELLSVAVDVQEDNLILISAYFKNTGESPIDATLDGTVFQNEEKVETFSTDSEVILPDQYEIFTYTYSELLSGAYTLDAEINSGNFVLAQEEEKFYSTDAVSLDSNVLVIFGLVMLLLLVSHYMLSRRKE